MVYNVVLADLRLMVAVIEGKSFTTMAADSPIQVDPRSQEEVDVRRRARLLSRQPYVRSPKSELNLIPDSCTLSPPYAAIGTSGWQENFGHPIKGKWA